MQCVAAWMVAALPCVAQDLSDATRIYSVRDDTGLSSLMATTSTKGYSLSDGSPVRFEDWYQAGWRDLSVTWMTQIDDHSGLIWGMGTGERGEKYRIDPSLRLGFVYRVQPRQNEALFLSVSSVFGGHLSEDTCTANYGAIGGEQEVNCRLASTPLPPSETLDYVFDLQPRSANKVELRYEFRF